MRRLDWAARLPGDRKTGWVNLHDLICPLGHRIRRDHILLSDSVLRCKHRPAQGEGECGKLMYIATCVLPRTPEREPTVCFAIEVTYDEAKQLERDRLGTFDVLKYLGVTMPTQMDPSTKESGQ